MVDAALDVPACLKTYVLNGTLVDVSISGASAEEDAV
jgi:hypothetical protein